MLPSGNTWKLSVCGTRWTAGYRPAPLTHHTAQRTASFRLPPPSATCELKFVVPYGRPSPGPPLTASFLGHSCGFSELVKTLRKDASSVLLYIVPKDQIFEAPLSLRGPRSSSRHSAQRSAGPRRLVY